MSISEDGTLHVTHNDIQQSEALFDKAQFPIDRRPNLPIGSRPLLSLRPNEFAVLCLLDNENLTVFSSLMPTQRREQANFVPLVLLSSITQVGVIQVFVSINNSCRLTDEAYSGIYISLWITTVKTRQKTR